MWKKIDNHEVVFELKPGDIITDQPGNASNEFIIERIFIDYVRIRRVSGPDSIRVFSGKELLDGRWWLKV